MDFRFAVLFLFLYYIRPQDWLPGMAGFNIMRPLTAVWIAAVFMSRSRSPIPGILRTPHDWLMLLYLVYVVWNAPDSQAAFNGFAPLVVFYFLTVHSLGTWDRALGFLKAWNFMLLAVAAIAIGSLFHLDFTGAADLTAMNKGRLCIGTWLHNNPNALGHSVVAIIPLSYLLYFWRGSAKNRLLIFPLCAGLAGWCAYKTESKGAFLVAGGLMVMLFVIGRPLAVKALALSIAATVGISALAFLPRMENVGNLRSDEGVQGRLLAWELAQTAMESHSTGVGWKQFLPVINWFGQAIPKATHSSYVQIGADLGMYGMFIFIAALWAACHSLLAASRFIDDDWRERCRRSGMVLLLAYVASSWMINREYHTEYFLVIAFAAAIHRLCLSAEPQMADEGAETADAPAEEQPAAAPVPKMRLAIRGAAGATQAHVVVTAPEASPEDEQPPIRPFWRRFGAADFAASIFLTWSVIYVWEYILRNL